MNLEQEIKSKIRDVKDFPKEGIIFKDITPLLLDWQLSEKIVNVFAEKMIDLKIDAICAIESRGFLYGMLLAHKLKIPFIPVRKKGKLPGETEQYTYELEYGSNTVEVHKNDVQRNWNILIHDDLLATGGTAIAAAEIMKKLGANLCAYAFVIELSFLNGRQRLNNYSNRIISLAKY